MTPDVPALTVDGLNAFYGRAHILFDVSLSVGKGEVVALLGRNGAGKSTTLKSIVGLVSDARGKRNLNGLDISGQPSYRISQAGLGYVPEERRIFTNLTVMENLEVGRQPPREGAPEWTPERLFELFPNLAEMRDRPGGRMSGGEQQMLTIARSLMGNPDTILLDEPSEGLAPVIVEQMARTITKLKHEGLTVLLSEQNLFFARALSDRAYVIESGRIRYQGSMTELMADETVRQAYLTV
ncbi:ABC transporter ATP-binding protein [Algihabitans albus]|uniref:ABC transporter ATP-binding protein n=1 Tax=Algihabitans albus TaxID=2164067 RepID=UPI000E5D74F4|nr:ABC transporter ATP-binding protein [Algihabitans albus]